MSEEIKSWKVVLDATMLSATQTDPAAETIELLFLDSDQNIPEIIVYKKNYFDDLVKLAKEKDQYSITGGLHDLIPPSGESLKGASIFAILAFHEQGYPFGYLIGEGEDELWKVLAVYPEELVSVVKHSEGGMMKLCVSIVANPENWTKVNVIGFSSGVSSSEEKSMIN
jgi:hypothetical protein